MAWAGMHNVQIKAERYNPGKFALPALQDWPGLDSNPG